MGVRSGGEPGHDHPPLRRMLHALDMTPEDLAREIAQGDRKYQRYVRKLLEDWQDKPLTQLPDVDRDDVWFEISNYVDKQTGYLLALRNELQRLLQRSREARAVRQQSLADLSPPPAPRSIPRRTP